MSERLKIPLRVEVHLSRVLEPPTLVYVGLALFMASARRELVVKSIKLERRDVTVELLTLADSAGAEAEKKRCEELVRAAVYDADKPGNEARSLLEMCELHSHVTGLIDAAGACPEPSEELTELTGMQKALTWAMGASGPPLLPRVLGG